MHRRLFARTLSSGVAALLGFASAVVAADKPNIVVVYVDDLGFGDVGCYGATGVETPHIDKLAKEGLMFTDAHCSAATCTPSWFALLTGSYAFRQRGQESREAMRRRSSSREPLLSHHC